MKNISNTKNKNNKEEGMPETVEVVGEYYEDKTIVIGKSDKVYEWTSANDKTKLLSKLHKGFTVCKDKDITVPFAKQKEDGTWIRSEFYEEHVLCEIPREKYKQIEKQHNDNAMNQMKRPDKTLQGKKGQIDFEQNMRVKKR